MAKKPAPRHRRAPTARRVTHHRRARGVSISNLIAGGAMLNGLSSIVLGRDLKNGLRGDDGLTWDQVADGTHRLDVLTWLKNASSPEARAERLRALPKVWANHLKGSLTTWDGAARVAGPVAAAVAIKTAIKIAKPNKYIPLGLRRYVRF